MSKLDGRFCAVTGGVNFVGRGGMKSKTGFHRVDEHNDVAHRYVGSMAVGGNNSWERTYGSAIMEVMTSGFYFWRRESVIRILLILTSRQYSCIVSALFRLEKDSSVVTKVTRFWRAARSQRFRRGFCVSQDE